MEFLTTKLKYLRNQYYNKFVKYIIIIIIITIEQLTEITLFQIFFPYFCITHLCYFNTLPFHVFDAISEHPSCR